MKTKPGNEKEEDLSLTAKKCLVVVHESNLEDGLKILVDTMRKGFQIKDKTIFGTTCIFLMERE